MAKQCQKFKRKNAEILHVINKYTQILRSRRKRVEVLLKKKSLKITFKTFQRKSTSNSVTSTSNI